MRLATTFAIPATADTGSTATRGGKPAARFRRHAGLLLLALSLAPLMPARAATDALAPLAWFVGSWQCAGRFADGRPIRSTETFTRELDGHWLRMHHADLPPNRYAADEWWGYDRAAGHFTVTVFDAMGGLRHYTSSGWQGDALTLENTATGGYVDRFVFHRQDASHYHFAYAHKDASGAWKTGDELTCTRMPPTPMPR